VRLINIFRRKLHVFRNSLIFQDEIFYDYLEGLCVLKVRIFIFKSAEIAKPEIQCTIFASRQLKIQRDNVLAFYNFHTLIKVPAKH